MSQEYLGGPHSLTRQELALKVVSVSFGLFEKINIRDPGVLFKISFNCGIMLRISWSRLRNVCSLLKIFFSRFMRCSLIIPISI